MSELLTGRQAADDDQVNVPAAADSDSSTGQNRSGSNPISSVSDSAVEYYHSVARLTVQAADALDYANTQGVLHRDVKPANLLLDGSGRLWVIDFGLAKAAVSDDLPHTGAIVGTLRYMAPEGFENLCTVQSDIYGLGLTLYELLTMQPAYDESNRAALVARVMHDAPPSPRTFDVKIPRDLETITEELCLKVFFFTFLWGWGLDWWGV